MFNGKEKQMNTRKDIINQIAELASEIRNDWTDPRHECRRIMELCNELLSEPEIDIVLKEYQCHKKVKAVKIGDVVFLKDSVVILPKDQEEYAFKVSLEYYEKHKPEVGGYYVVYEDGYESYSPAKAFEKGYTKIIKIKDEKP